MKEMKNEARSCHNIQNLFIKVLNEKEKEAVNCDIDNTLLKEPEHDNVAVTQDSVLLSDDNKTSNFEIGINDIKLFAKACTLCNTIYASIKTSNVCKRGLSYRGNKYEAAYSLEDLSLDHGNFLEISILLKKFDVVLNGHLDLVIKKSKASHESGNKNRGGLLTILSKTTINMVIECIGQEIKTCIAQEVQEAGMFTVELDTTQDISVKDQCSVVLRYVNKSGIQERLIAIVNCIDSSGKGIFELLKKVLCSNNLNIENCVANSSDGAASMQGQYNGFSTWLGKASPGQMHVWCYSHILNLVISDVTKTPISAATMFSLMKSDTKWWSKDLSLRRIFGTPNNSQNALYVEVLISLHAIEDSVQFTLDVRSKATHFKESLLKYSTLLTAFLYLRIFEITTPFSKYLQTSGMDIQKAYVMVENTVKELKLLKRDEAGLKNCVGNFINTVNIKLDEKNQEENSYTDFIIESELPTLRTRKKKKQFDDRAEDEPIIDPYKKFVVEVYNVVMGGVINIMEKRFLSNSKIYADLSCLFPSNFNDIKNGLPAEAFDVLVSKLIKFDPEITTDKLRSELIHFSNNWDSLKKNIPESYTINHIDDEDNDDNDDNDEYNLKKHNNCTTLLTCKNCALCCYTLLMKYNLYSNAYSTLTLTYKFLLTLPTTQVACERSFSILKCIKTRLRSTLSDSYLEDFILMAVEKKILNYIDTEEIIDKLKKNLLGGLFGLYLELRTRLEDK
ncbi:hypothetical protein AGLY_003865 [Aphis glycines]|uniref:DUF4371 domain-containing protein n=1 Tax=Aphis glycines TaxID=307491 RepID=A0A6G0U1X2_APHGL|nr:hypothetical protein AGLY_003865 [Aphis glycines]